MIIVVHCKVAPLCENRLVDTIECVCVCVAQMIVDVRHPSINSSNCNPKITDRLVSMQFFFFALASNRNMCIYLHFLTFQNQWNENVHFFTLVTDDTSKGTGKWASLRGSLYFIYVIA